MRDPLHKVTVELTSSLSTKLLVIHSDGNRKQATTRIGAETQIVKHNILILGASYGSLFGTKLLMAGHRVSLVCTSPPPS